MFNSKKKTLFNGFAVSILTTLCFNIIIVSFHLIHVENLSFFIHMTLPCIISMIVIPFFVEKKIFKTITPSINQILRQLFIFGLTFIPFSIFYFLKYSSKFDNIDILVNLITHYLVVACGEEYIYRHIIFKIVKANYNDWLAIIFSSVLFAFIAHLNEPIIDNLYYRLPMGIFLCIVAKFLKGIGLSVSLHAIYNLMVII
ncbi:MAG: CPBP family intramembrane metalloprotease [Streptococcaceae bacterium]|nr:CPBP family intramembrane metalloprotease [Streptococcaceae bacterium]